MSIISKILEFLTVKNSENSHSRDKIMKVTIEGSRDILKNLPLTKHMSYNVITELENQLHDMIKSILSSDNILLALREKLAVTVLEYARYQVLVIPSEEQVDITGLRDGKRVTGVLKNKLSELVAINEELKRIMGADISSPADLVLFRYWKYYWFAGTLNTCRYMLNDFCRPRDWYYPFTYAMCVRQESIYRRELNLEYDTIDEMAYSTFYDIVISGVTDPANEWVTNFQGSMDNGSLQLLYKN